DNALLLTHRTGAETFVTVAAGCELSARNHEPVILDFPFLYQRFASLNAAAVPHAAVGVVSNPLPYLDTRLHSTYFWLPLTDFEPGFALESEAQLGLALSDEVRLSVAARWALARYPVGRRTHWLPWLDLRWAW